MKEVLTRERAIELHRQMWTDMQRRLGDNPTDIERLLFKSRWCEEHSPYGKILNDCFLCEYVTYYANERTKHKDCGECCPIKWADGSCILGEKRYNNMPISELLALPERSDES